MCFVVFDPHSKAILKKENILYSLRQRVLREFRRMSRKIFYTWRGAGHHYVILSVPLYHEQVLVSSWLCHGMESSYEERRLKIKKRRRQKQSYQEDLLAPVDHYVPWSAETEIDQLGPVDHSLNWQELIIKLIGPITFVMREIQSKSFEEEQYTLSSQKAFGHIHLS